MSCALAGAADISETMATAAQAEAIRINDSVME
jgi:hypothetical protein